MTNKTNELMQIGLRLSNCRQDRNMTQEDLAGRLGITPQAVSKWERGTSLPDISMLSDLARILDVSADWLLGLQAERSTDGYGADNTDEDAAQMQLVQLEMGNCLRNCIDPLELAFGEDILPLFMGSSTFLERIRQHKVQLAKEGIWTPIVRIRDLLSLGKKEFVILSYHKILYSETLDVIEEGTLAYILDRLAETIQDKYHEILHPDLLKDMVDNLKIRYPALFEGIVPEKISYGLLTETVRITLTKGIQVRYLPKMIELMECALRQNSSATPQELAEYIQQRVCFPPAYI